MIRHKFYTVLETTSFAKYIKYQIKKKKNNFVQVQLTIFFFFLFIQVWDRRSLREDDPKPVGTLVGHKGGITYIDPRGDGRHLITNSKDQTIKLWDARVFSSKKVQEQAESTVSITWDYRWQHVPKKCRLHVHVVSSFIE